MFCLKQVYVQLFDLFPGPGRSSKKFQTGFHAGVINKALDRDTPAQFLPAILAHQMVQDHFQRYTMQGIVRLFNGHELLFIYLYNKPAPPSVIWTWQELVMSYLFFFFSSFSFFFSFMFILGFFFCSLFPLFFSPISASPF